MLKPSVPTLGSQTHITNPVQILAYTLNQFAAAPKSATVTWVDETISLKELISKHMSNDSTTLEDKIVESLTSCLQRVFGDTSTVTVEVTRINQSAGFVLQLSLTVVVNDKPYGLDHNVSVDETGHLQYQVL